MTNLENRLFEQLWAKMTGRPSPCLVCMGPLTEGSPYVETGSSRYDACSLPCAMRLAQDMSGVTGIPSTIKGNR